MDRSGHKKKIGILGGTFDPPHQGHIILAEAARKQLDLNKVIFIPAKEPPHKQCENIVDVELRYEMVKLAVGNNADFYVSRFEIEKRGISYSIETLNYLQKLEPSAEFYFIVGSDAIPEIKTWKKIDKLLNLCVFTVGMRPGFIKYEVPDGMILLEGVFPDISSRQIREILLSGGKTKDLIPDNVYEFIKERRIYQ